MIKGPSEEKREGLRPFSLEKTRERCLQLCLAITVGGMVQSLIP